MITLWWWACVAQGPSNGGWGGGGSPNDDLGGGGAGTDDTADRSDDSGGGGGGDDCVLSDLTHAAEWSGSAYGPSGGLATGATLFVRGLVQNECTNAIALTWQSDCYFDHLTLSPDVGEPVTHYLDCTSTPIDDSIDAGAARDQWETWGAVYTTGGHTLELFFSDGLTAVTTFDVE